MTENIYVRKGYKNRRNYLEHVADDYGVPIESVFLMAEVLGADEDFDALLIELEDMHDLFD